MKIVRKRQSETLGKCPIKKNPLVGSGLSGAPDALHWGLDNNRNGNIMNGIGMCVQQEGFN